MYFSEKISNDKKDKSLLDYSEKDNTMLYHPDFRAATIAAASLGLGGMATHE